MPLLSSSLTRIQAGVAVWLKRTPLARCLVNDGSCCGAAIQAHSVQRSGSLAAISESGHVYMFEHRVGKGFQLAKVGTGHATTFQGFCAHHDRSVFFDIDFEFDRRFDPENRHQAVLLALRAVACEYWKK